MRPSVWCIIIPQSIILRWQEYILIYYEPYTQNIQESYLPYNQKVSVLSSWEITMAFHLFF
jgi:hypothetical protein